MLGKSLAVGVDLNQLLSKSKYNYLEIGCYDGINLATLSKNFADKKIYGVDPFISDGHVKSDLGEQKNNLYKNIENCPNIVFFEKTNEQFYKEQISNFKNFNISSIFIDGAHILQFIKVDVDIALDCIKNNHDASGFIVFHDTHVPDVLEAIEYFKDICKERNIKYSLIKQNGYYAEFEVLF